MPTTKPYPFAALLVLATLSAGCTADDDPPRARNLLLITVDTLRADHLGCYGGRRGASPSIDAFAKDAVLFEQAQSHSSWTLPAIASLITSTYPTTHGLAKYNSRLDPSFVTLPEVLAQKGGFWTGAVTSHVYVGPQHGMDQGIAEFDWSLVEGGKQAEDRVTSPEVTRRGIEWLRKAAAGSERWFLWLHYFDPHHPYERHAGISERFGDRDVDLYDGEIAFTDQHLGQVFAELARLGLDGDTAVLLVSDHGEEFRDRDKIRHGFTLFQEVARVPMMLRVPGLGGRRVADPVPVVDMLPTVLDLLGLAAPPAVEGRSLVPALDGAPVPERPALAELQLNRGYRSDSLRLGKWKLVVDHENTSRVGYANQEGGPPVKNGDQPIPPAVEPGPVHLLFDLEADPQERQDLADRHPEIVQGLRTTLERMLRKARELAESGGYQVADPLDLSEEQRRLLEQIGYGDG